jgi:hypothetical protein
MMSNFDLIVLVSLRPGIAILVQRHSELVCHAAALSIGYGSQFAMNDPVLSPSRVRCARTQAKLLREFLPMLKVLSQCLKVVSRTASAFANAIHRG